MGEEVISLSINVFGKVIADEEAPVVIGIEAIGTALSIGHQNGVIIWLVEVNFVHILRTVVHVDNFKTAELVVSVKDEVLVMLILQHARTDVGGLNICHCHVGPIVLADNHFKLLSRTFDGVVGMSDAKRHLLVRGIGVHIGV